MSTALENPHLSVIFGYPLNPANHNQQFIIIKILSPNLDPMSYPILVPLGEHGWKSNWNCEPYEGPQRDCSRINLNMLQYKAALLTLRDEFNPIISTGRHTEIYC